MEDCKSKLKNSLAILEAPDDEKTVNVLMDFMELVLAKNEITNLTAITDREEFIEKHIIDSVLCYGWDEISKAARVIDVGTGAGFPGIPLAILYPQKEFLLIDSLNKRIEFINEAIQQLGLKNVDALHSRAEDAGRDAAYREGFDLCLGRAVSKLSALLEYCVPLIDVGGYLYAYKGPNADEEIESAQMALNVLGARINDIRKTELAGIYFDHRVVVIEKIRKTPDKYPRKSGLPKKVPL